MRFKIVFGIVSALCLVAPAASLAQEKVPVNFINTTSDDDQIGRQLAFEIKEAIRGSHGFRLLDDPTQWPHIRYEVLTIKITPGSGTAAAHSFSYDDVGIPLRGALITTSVQTCGSNQILTCARRILSVLDEVVESLGKEKLSALRAAKSPRR